MKLLDRPRYKILASLLLPPILVTVVLLLILILGKGWAWAGLLVIVASGLGAASTAVVFLRVANKLGEQETDFLEQIECQQRTLVDLGSQIARLKDEKLSLEQYRDRVANQEDDALQMSEKVIRECESAVAESKRLKKEVRLLQGVVEALGSDQSPNAILETICRELALAFSVAQCAAALMNTDKSSLTVVAEYLTEGYTSALGFVIPVEGNPATLYVLKNRVPLAVYDAQQDILLAPIQDIMKQRGSVSLLLLPILVNNEVVGTIGLDSTTPREFNDCEIAMASRILGAVARSLEHPWQAQGII